MRSVIRQGPRSYGSGCRSSGRRCVLEQMVSANLQLSVLVISGSLLPDARVTAQRPSPAWNPPLPEAVGRIG